MIVVVEIKETTGRPSDHDQNNVFTLFSDNKHDDHDKVNDESGEYLHVGIMVSQYTSLI